MKKNVGRFKLVCTLPLLEGELHEELGILGESKLLEDLLQDQAVSQEYLEIKNMIQLFITGRYPRIQTCVTTE